MKWVGTDKWLTWGFVHQCSQPIGGPPTGQVWTICHHSEPLCGRVSVATASAVAIVCRDSVAHIFIAGLVWAPQQKQIDTYKPKPHLARMTHFKWTKKDILVRGKSWEKLGSHSDCAVKAATGH